MTLQKVPFDVLRSGRGPLDAIFAPRNVAVVGATDTPGSVGRTVLWNLISTPFGGAVFPVNPRRQNVLGIRAYADVASIPDPVDLAVVITPAAAVPGVIRSCGEAGVQGAIVISAGFKEAGAAGAALEAELKAEARRWRMRVIGPNCLGVMNPITGLNATFAASMARPGKVAFLSQSGALCTAVLDWSTRENIGFSAFVSAGSMADIGWGDLIDYLATDPETESIVIYMESVGDARSFMSAAREVALTKPIVVIKAGRTEAASKAAASHTGALTGSDEVLDAAFRRCGVHRVDRISDLFHIAEVLANQPRPAGSRLAVVTNAGGPGVLAADALIANGGELATLSPETLATLDSFLPRSWSHANPIDVLGDADPDRYLRAIEVVIADTNNDGLLAILTPQAMTDPTGTAERLEALVGNHQKPVLASWMGGAGVEAGQAALQRARIPSFAYPDTAAAVFGAMWRNSENLRALYETPSLAGEDDDTAGRDRASALIDGIRATRRTLLTEAESKQLLALYGFPVPETRVAATPDDAARAAAAIGYPVVVKLHSETVTHKTDVGGVRLDLASEEAVRTAFSEIEAAVTRLHGGNAFLGVTVQPMVRTGGYEDIFGATVDPQFGPVLLFGSGGQLVEVYEDKVLALPPLTTTLARRAMERTRILKALRGVRGRKPCDIPALERLFVRFGQLMAEQLYIAEIDINPLLVSPEGMVALDARVVLFDAARTLDSIPRPAIRPYPGQYTSHWTMRDGIEVTIRPIRPEDEPLMVRFHRSLSESTVYARYFQDLNLDSRIAHERLQRICFTDYDRELALVAETRDGRGEREIIAVGRLSRVRGTADAEFAILVADAYQERGLGSELVRRIIGVARAEGIEALSAEILPENELMQRIAGELGFTVAETPGESTVTVAMRLGGGR